MHLHISLRRRRIWVLVFVVYRSLVALSTILRLFSLIGVFNHLVMSLMRS
ncbi:hypothetical protein HanIR_Chr06g0266481 [Helianthus annuus]|nr:hypothetical protein HanIR_Chr06g0266481 [Helianthus annuus]